MPNLSPVGDARYRIIRPGCVESFDWLAICSGGSCSKSSEVAQGVFSYRGHFNEPAKEGGERVSGNLAAFGRVRNCRRTAACGGTRSYLHAKSPELPCRLKCGGGNRRLV